MSGGADELTRGQCHGAHAPGAAVGLRGPAPPELEPEATVAQRTSELTQSNEELSCALATLQTAQRELVESENWPRWVAWWPAWLTSFEHALGNALTVVTALEDRYKELERMLSGGGSPTQRAGRPGGDSRHGRDILHRNVQRPQTWCATSAGRHRPDHRPAPGLRSGAGDRGRAGDGRAPLQSTPYVIKTELEAGLHGQFPGLLGQVLTNLLMNTLVHAFDGRADGTVRVMCRAVSSLEVELQVIDDGRGMDENVRRRIFDPSSRPSSAQAARASGCTSSITSSPMCSVA